MIIRDLVQWFAGVKGDAYDASIPLTAAQTELFDYMGMWFLIYSSTIVVFLIAMGWAFYVAIKASNKKE